MYFEGGARQQRTLREALVDGLMTLALFHMVNESGPVGDRLKAMKLLFVATYRLFERRAKGLNFAFYRYTYGPFTPQVYATWGDLAATGLLHIDPEPWGGIELTAEGHRIAERFVKDILSTDANREFLKALGFVADTYAPLSTPECLRVVYKMRVRPLWSLEETEVAKLPDMIPITRILEQDEAASALELPLAALAAFDQLRAIHFSEDPAREREALATHTQDTIEVIAASLDAFERGEVERVSASEFPGKYGISG